MGRTAGCSWVQSNNSGRTSRGGIAGGWRNGHAAVRPVHRRARVGHGVRDVVQCGRLRDLIRYSPLQNVKPGSCYPATLITTADHDDRVVPSHSFKFTAAMQQAQACPRPILIRVETQGSHGYRPTDKRIAELADQWAFAAAAMGMNAPR